LTLCRSPSSVQAGRPVCLPLALAFSKAASYPACTQRWPSMRKEHRMPAEPRLPIRPVSRRQILRSAALGGSSFALAGALACGNKKTQIGASTGSGSGNAGKQVKRGGTLVRASTNQFDANLDPHPLQPVYTSYYNLFYQTLLQLNPRTAALEPQLAAKWEQPSQTEYLFHLQP